MARVAQVGNTDTQAAYNRSIVKEHQPMRSITARGPDDFELGQDGAEEKVVLVLEMKHATSVAAMCVSEKCAMWRWSGDNDGAGYCGLAGKPLA